METIRYTKMDTDKIIKTLINGGIVAFPTDTVFGLACIMEKEAIAKVYEAKGRSFDKPLPMMCDSFEMIDEVAYVNAKAKKIIDVLMPGALTLIFRKKECVEDYVTMCKPTIGIRVPEDDFILNLIGKIGMPFLVTSANVSGEGSLLKWQDVLACMEGKIDAIVCEDARGECASTIIDVTEEDIKVLREGPVSLKEIQEVLQ
ncbi:MAG: threonylcarbamoyl-AMP synthase [Erysipelotrichaceae bacterium]|nr:threonylcarbamoyl-AMP synthase [Erysipelotrichaceae bacterium]